MINNKGINDFISLCSLVFLPLLRIMCLNLNMEHFMLDLTLDDLMTF